MKKTIIIDGNFPTETRVALLDKKNNIEHIDFSAANKKQIKGNIYLAKVSRVEPSLQAAFIEYGEEKSGFLPFSEIHPDYYQILSSNTKSGTIVGKELISPEITSEDLEEAQNENNFPELADSDDIDIDAIEKMVDEKLHSDINISIDENEVDSIEKKAEIDEKPFKIQEVIKRGQIILVQVTKEERGNKGASLTTYISLAGKYCVLMPNKSGNNGISRKISNHDERKRLKKIVNDLAEKSNSCSSIIIRTAGAGYSTLEIKKDYDYLARLWNKIREMTLKSNAPCFIHQEDGIILKTIRDIFDRNVKEIVVQGTEAYNLCKKYMEDVLPSQTKAVREYKGKVPIFTKFGIEDQLIKLYQPIVNLPSGGYIVINPTEALISIDVNSGRSTSERNIEEMALKTNLEAAREIARQARLRDLSGLLVLDFIDLNETKNKKILERSLWEYFTKDKARIQTAPISLFGLLEMSRQRLRPSFLEMNSNICSHCSGKGIVRADESNSMLILRTIENEISGGKYDTVNVFGIASSILYLLNHKREEISFIESKYSIKLNFSIDRDATSDSYSIEKIKLPNKNKPINNHLSPALQDTSEIYNETEEVLSNTIRKKINKNRDVSADKNVNQNITKIEDESDELPKQEQKTIPEKIGKNSNARKRRIYRNKKRNSNRINTEAIAEAEKKATSDDKIKDVL
jgi:ribonuclease E